MTYAFSTIRNDIQYEHNCNILLKIISVLNASEKYEDNQIRKALASIEGLDRERWYYVYYNNVYVHRELLKYECIYLLFIKLCKELHCVLSRGSFEKAYDFIDSFHCLPDILADHHFLIPKNYWKIYVWPYRKKWDIDFLTKEEKNINGFYKKHVFPFELK